MGKNEKCKKERRGVVWVGSTVLTLQSPLFIQFSPYYLHSYYYREVLLKLSGGPLD